MESAATSPCSLPVTPPFSPLVGGCNDDFATTQCDREGRGKGGPDSKAGSGSGETSLLGVMKVSLPLLSKEDAIEQERRFLNERMQALKKQNLERRQRAAARHRLMLAAVERERAAALADRHKKVQAGKVLLQRGLAAAVGSGPAAKTCARRSSSDSPSVSTVRVPCAAGRRWSEEMPRHPPPRSLASSGEKPLSQSSSGLPPLPCKTAKERLLPACLNSSQAQSKRLSPRQGHEIKEVTCKSELPLLRRSVAASRNFKAPSPGCCGCSNPHVEEAGANLPHSHNRSTAAQDSVTTPAALAEKAQQDWLRGGIAAAAGEPYDCDRPMHSVVKSGDRACHQSKLHSHSGVGISPLKRTQRTLAHNTPGKVEDAARRVDCCWHQEMEQHGHPFCSDARFAPDQPACSAALQASDHGATRVILFPASSGSGPSQQGDSSCHLRQKAGLIAAGEYFQASAFVCRRCVNAKGGKDTSQGAHGGFLTRESSRRNNECRGRRQLLCEYHPERRAPVRRKSPTAQDSDPPSRTREEAVWQSTRGHNLGTVSSAETKYRDSEKPLRGGRLGEPGRRELVSANRQNNKTTEEKCESERHGSDSEDGQTKQKSQVKVANRKLKSLIERQLTSLQRDCQTSSHIGFACQSRDKQSTVSRGRSLQVPQLREPAGNTRFARQASTTGCKCTTADRGHKLAGPIRSLAPSRRNTGPAVFTANWDGPRDDVTQRYSAYSSSSQARRVLSGCCAWHSESRQRPLSCSLPRHTPEEELGDQSLSAPATYARVSPVACGHDRSRGLCSYLRGSPSRFLSFRGSSEEAPSPFGSRSSLSDPAVSLDSCTVSHVGHSPSDFPCSRDAQRGQAGRRLPPLPPRARQARRLESPACDCCPTALSQERKASRSNRGMPGCCNPGDYVDLPTTAHWQDRQNASGKERCAVEGCLGRPNSSRCHSSDCSDSEQDCGHCRGQLQSRNSHLYHRRREAEPRACSCCCSSSRQDHHTPTALRGPSDDMSRKTKALEDAERRVEERLLILDVNQMVLEQQSERRKQLHQQKLMTLLEQRGRPEASAAVRCQAADQKSRGATDMCITPPAKASCESSEHPQSSFADEKGLIEPVVSLSTAPTRAGTNGTLDRNKLEQNPADAHTAAGSLPSVRLDEKSCLDDRNTCSKRSRIPGPRSSRTGRRQSQQSLQLRARGGSCAPRLPAGGPNTAQAHPGVA